MLEISYMICRFDQRSPVLRVRAKIEMEVGINQVSIPRICFVHSEYKLYCHEIKEIELYFLTSIILDPKHGKNVGSTQKFFSV